MAQRDGQGVIVEGETAQIVAQGHAVQGIVDGQRHNAGTGVGIAIHQVDSNIGIAAPSARRLGKRGIPARPGRAAARDIDVHVDDRAVVGKPDLVSIRAGRGAQRRAQRDDQCMLPHRAALPGLIGS